jgi:hypothetical protein
MSAHDPRDRALELLLGRAVAPGPLTPDCLEAETLAAWADGGLGEQARLSAETHMASCVRCQSVMASIVSSAPEPASASAFAGHWWRPELRWLVPLAGAATAAVLWLVIPASRPDQVAELADRDRPAYAMPPPSPPAASSPAPAGPSEGVAEKKATEVERAEPPARQQTPGSPESDEPARMNREPAAGSADLLAKAEERAASGAEAPRPAATPQAPADTEPPAIAQEAPSAPPPAAQAFGISADARRSAASNAIIDLVSRDPAVRWRLARPGIVERSTDGGATWQPLDTGTRAALTGGSCPSASVCWVVGPAGLVLVTADARSWRQVPFPASHDLVAVEAGDARTATVRGGDGQVHRTTDGGTTWTRVP